MLRPAGARQLAWLTRLPLAHRGLHDAAAGVIENTASAFSAAIAHNYAIECDVQLAADGSAVVFHDETLDRLTDASGLLADRTAAELKRIRIKDSRDRLPTLAEVLAQVNGRVGLVIELKSRWDGRPDLARRVARALEAYGGACAVMSFDPDLIEVLATHVPTLPRGMVADRMSHPSWAFLPLSQRIALRCLTHLERTRPHFISFDAAALPWPPARRFRDRCGPVLCWTVRSAAQAALARRHCDQITFEGYLP